METILRAGPASHPTAVEICFRVFRLPTDTFPLCLGFLLRVWKTSSPSYSVGAGDYLMSAALAREDLNVKEIQTLNKIESANNLLLWAGSCKHALYRGASGRLKYPQGPASLNHERAAGEDTKAGFGFRV